MVLNHQDPLEGYDKRIGGSLGKGTHGGTETSTPDEYPDRNDWDYEVSTTAELVNRIQEDNVIVGLDPSVDEFIINGYNEVTPGENTALVGHYCNPDVAGRGPVIRKTHYEKCFLKTRQPFHMYGVSLRGPMRGYFDPRKRAQSPEWNSDKKEDWHTAGVWVMTDKREPTSNFVGCEFWGWTWAAVVLGAKNYQTQGRFYRCSFHECIMETLGYGVTQFDGHAELDLCFFDECRHAVAGYGYPTETCHIRRCLAGPGPYSGHVIDRHELSEDNPVSGKWIRINDCTFMNDMSLGPNGKYPDESIKLRGLPERQSWVRNSHFTKKNQRPVGAGEDGDAYLQEGRDELKRFSADNNIYGPEIVDGHGAPRSSNPGGETPETGEQILTIHGQNIDAEYTIEVDGEVSKTDDIESGSDIIEDNEKGGTTIHGIVNPANDSYRLGEDAEITRFETTGFVKVTLNGEPANLSVPVMLSLTEKLDNASIDF
ncbi:hypothetical protein [Halocatena halophila]|uniref:hypothetical protein n=1 Tax=Halocatena halophila TaxID=2814576 RepID=UPI002ED26A29